MDDLKDPEKQRDYLEQDGFNIVKRKSSIDATKRRKIFPTDTDETLGTFKYYDLDKDSSTRDTVNQPDSVKVSAKISKKATKGKGRSTCRGKKKSNRTNPKSGRQKRSKRDKWTRHASFVDEMQYKI